MTRFHEQIMKARADMIANGMCEYIYPEADWEETDFRDWSLCMDHGYIIQECGDCFAINEYHIEEGKDFYKEYFIDSVDYIDGEHIIREKPKKSMSQKISDWLNDRNNNENDLVDFLVDNCGVVLTE